MSNRIITFAICLFVVPSLDALAEDISPLKLLLESKPPKYTAPADDDINTIDTPVVKLLRHLPSVAKVDVRGADKPVHRIIHLQDRHFVTQDVFAADLRDVSDDPVTDKEIDRLYDQFLLEVAQVQSEQKAMLRCLIQHHGLRQVYVESLADRDIPILNAQVRVLRR